MTSAVLLALTLAAAAWALRTARTPQPGRVPGALARLAALFALEHVLFEAGHLALPAAGRPVLLAMRALTGLAMWTQVAWLSAYGGRTRGSVRVRVVFAGITLALVLAHAPWPVLVLIALPAVSSFGWRATLDTRRLFVTAASGIGLLAFGALARFRASAEPVPVGGALDLWHYAKWANAVAIAYVAFGISKSVDAWVLDPSLGLRRIRSRLALSHTLVAGVPLAIVASLWVFTTWLGVNSERAVVATRAFQVQAEDLRGALAQALGTPGDARAPLAALGESRRATWPHLAVWRIAGGGVERILGDSVRAEPELPGWCAAADSLPTACVVELGGRRFMGALARDPVRGAWAVALVPAMEALTGSPARISGARLWMRERLARPGATPGAERLADSLARGGRAAAPAHADSMLRGAAASESARASAAGRGGPRLRFTASPEPEARRSLASFSAGEDTIDVGGEDPITDSTGTTGGAILHGVHGARAGWSAADFSLRARVPLLETVAGLYHSTRENPFSFIPIAILAALVLLTLPVTGFNFKLVRQLGRSVLQPVVALEEGTRALADARLDYRIDVRGDDELWAAASAFNRMSAGLERARELELARDRLERELDLARRIQQRLLPAAPPAVAGLEVAGTSVPAREVGGDYFDHVPLADGRVLLVVADVSGKGVPAALLMSAFRAALLSQDAAATPPGEIASRLNAFLHRSVESGRFVTAFLGLLDGASGQLVYANAGHNPPALLRADGRVEWLPAGGLILGILPEARFEPGETRLEPGDLLALYTDGVTEGANAAGEQFGEERMLASLRARMAGPCGEIAGALVEDVRTFEGETGPADDVTVLVARVRFDATDSVV